MTGIIEDFQRAHFFPQSTSGINKTFLYTTLCYYYRAQGKIVLCMTSSKIAVKLLPSGQTSHSRFLIPLIIHQVSTAMMKKDFLAADSVRNTALIIWDKVSMQNKFCFVAVDQILQDIRSNLDALFGGMPTMLGRDFAQILPVVKNNN